MENNRMSKTDRLLVFVFVGLIVTGIVLKLAGFGGAGSSEPKTIRERIEAHLSSYDGSHPELETYIKKHMNDPDSYEHVETKFIVPEEPANSAVFITTFRGKNAFGGKVLNTIKARCDIDTGEILAIIE